MIHTSFYSGYFRRMRKFGIIAVLSLIFFASCKKELVDTSANEIVDHTDVTAFNQAVASGVSFVFFHANWCHNCEEQRPAFEATVNNSSVSFVKFFEVDHVFAEAIFEDHNINGFPHMLVFVDGIEVERLIGKGHSEEQFVNLLLQYK